MDVRPGVSVPPDETPDRNQICMAECNFHALFEQLDKKHLGSIFSPFAGARR
jgi:hypothetical protein